MDFQSLIENINDYMNTILLIYGILFVGYFFWCLITFTVGYFYKRSQERMNDYQSDELIIEKDHITNLTDTNNQLTFLIVSLNNRLENFQEINTRLIQELTELKDWTINNYYGKDYRNLMLAFEKMTTVQLKKATTQMDLDKISNSIGKTKYIYSVLLTIARKAVKNQNKDCDYLLDVKHMLTAETKTFLTENYTKCKKEWCDFLTNYIDGCLEL